MSHARSLKKQLQDVMDCPCSALSINCCQLGCFIADEPMVQYETSNSDWMEQVMVAKPDVTLRSLVIPGSHDSATCTIDNTKLFSAVGKCQNLSVSQQLERGCRYLDLRVAGSGDEKESVRIYHGFLEGGAFQTVLEDMHSFLQSHKKEFVVLEVVREHGRDMSPEQAKYALDLVKSTFRDMAYQEQALFPLLSGKPLKHYVDSGVQVVVLVHPRIYGFIMDGQEYNEEYLVQNYRFFHSGRWMRSQWHNTRDKSQLLEWNLDQVHKWGDNQGILLNNQFILTPGVGGVGDVVNLLVGKNSLRPVSFATSLYQKDVLDEFMRKHADEPWNMVMLDFVDLAPALLSFLIGLNFPKRVKVVAAAASSGSGSSTDITTNVQSYIKRDKVLYLTNIRKDLGLNYDEGRLTIAYQIGNDKQNQILDVDFDATTEIVVSQYSHNEGVFVHVDPTTDGVFHRGRMMRLDEYESIGTKDGAAPAIRSGAISIVN